jgi:hypothetical protein
MLVPAATLRAVLARGNYNRTGDLHE